MDKEKPYTVTISGDSNSIERFKNILGRFVDYEYTEVPENPDVSKVFNRTIWAFDDFKIILKYE